MCCIGENGPFSIRNRFCNYAVIDDKIISLFMMKHAFYICKNKRMQISFCCDHVCVMFTPYLPDHLLSFAQLTPYLPLYLISVCHLTPYLPLHLISVCQLTPHLPVHRQPVHQLTPYLLSIAQLTLYLPLHLISVCQLTPTSTCPSPICLQTNKKSCLSISYLLPN